jgi:hypothetical protein
MSGQLEERYLKVSLVENIRKSVDGTVDEESNKELVGYRVVRVDELLGCEESGFDRIYLVIYIGCSWSEREFECLVQEHIPMFRSMIYHRTNSYDRVGQFMFEAVIRISKEVGMLKDSQYVQFGVGEVSAYSVRKVESYLDGIRAISRLGDELKIVERGDTTMDGMEKLDVLQV